MKNKISDIEVLRGLAVIYVFFWHLWPNLIALPEPYFTLLTQYTYTANGVDLFFVISGFVIARDLVPRLQAVSETGERYTVIISFWIRRAWRILPSAWLWLVVIMLGAVFFNESGIWGPIRDNWGGVVSAVFQVANLRFAASFEQFPFGAAFPYWSLSLEEQFYLLFPFLILISSKRLPYVLLAIVLLQLVLPRPTLAILLRTDALALGVLLAIWTRTDSYRYFEPIFLAHSGSARILTLSVLMIGLGSVNATGMHIPFGFSLVAFISAILVFIASWNKSYLMGDGWLKSVLLWVGARSYAIYLTHIPAIYTAREILSRYGGDVPLLGQNQNLAIFLVAAFLSCLLSDLNYRLLEIPMKRRGAVIAKDFANR